MHDVFGCVFCVCDLGCVLYKNVFIKCIFGALPKRAEKQNNMCTLGIFLYLCMFMLVRYCVLHA